MVSAILILVFAWTLSGVINALGAKAFVAELVRGAAGADCDHISHVNTQLSYAITVAGVSFVGYVLTGFVRNVWIVLPVSFLMMFAVLMGTRAFQNKKA